MELLIVIGVLGILAAGLLAAIDPFEQLKKARDTNNRSAAIELLQGSQRYYATHGYLPWRKPDGAGGFTCTGTDIARLRPVVDETAYPYSAVSLEPQAVSGDMYDCLNLTLAPDGEIKTTFFQGLATTLYLFSGSKTHVGVCFSPEGKSNRTDAQTQYDLGGTDDATFAIQDGGICPNVASDACLQCFE
ncbi:MAG: hypothetical protein UX12_C0027G0006 [Candidatus Collierbacteria bacterium GW2011_GWC1_45_47]|uniref:Uncharacterized protein n=5 Tax=Candidatus Collieribacteriota TaxID=1752725 RepID=A0A0G1KH49_9BACT|nr:MAG: hypothetical protein UW23_C0002G0019 [Candidatus Collierbacteria bacterium GW2011_GWA1_44_12]KKT39262.1 MAG: hypothetical protein UW26_C0005G0006 [Candidatus Collierbacteria bacterium GW2011_GWF1_44_12]KKT47184.1 MAG: hypothetical protein UW35_C0002G0013 [Candidatus Collierbacteria bacterium GW2011_GWF2_44_15]KKT67867.1 MAG: hypothetical protein UW62_C0013G0002 [Candidatus Collierbacteria bacterium GW2011_GWB1_44_35]KKT99444.1 MAG: hypothetical protein UW99_C0006G0017 [Candidatus Collie